MLIVAENHKIVICIVINFNALDVIKTFADHIIVLRGYQEVRGEGGVGVKRDGRARRPKRTMETSIF